MREYGQIQTGFWTDPDIQSLTDQGKLLAAYLLTGPHANSLGCMRVPQGYVMEDLGWPSETVSKAFQELFRIGFCRADKTLGWVLLPKYLQFNPVSNPNVAKAIEKVFHTVPSEFEYYQELIDSLKRFGKHFSNDFETLLQTVSKPYRNKDQDQEQEQEQEQEVGSEPETDSSPPNNQTPLLAEPERSPDPAVITIPLVDKTEFEITQAMVDEWQQTFPAVDVMQELREIRIWNVDNKSKRKTRKGIRQHISIWLGKEQDRGGNKPSGPKHDPTKPHLPYLN